MVVTFEGIVIEARLLHPEKAPSLMVLTLSGIVIEVKLEQSLKA